MKGWIQFFLSVTLIAQMDNDRKKRQTRHSFVYCFLSLGICNVTNEGPTIFVLLLLRICPLQMGCR